MEKHYFSIGVNCFLLENPIIIDEVQEFEEIHQDNGCIMLPDSYTEDGTPTRLVINCHGAGGSVDTDDSQMEGQLLSKYLLANGYAVMDVNGLPATYAQKHNIDIRNNVGSPIAIRSYVKGYFYCMEHFNLKPEVFVHGASMGGISSTNLVLSGCMPVIAHSAFCPVLDTYHQIFLNPWSKGLPKEAIGKLYGFEKNEQGEYIYDEEKLRGYNPVRNEKAKRYPVPVKFWHCLDDTVVSYEVTKNFIERIRENGGMAYLRTFPYGGHEASSAGKAVEHPCGNVMFCGSELKLTPAVEEAFIWIRNFS